MDAPDIPAPPPAAGKPRLLACPVCGGVITLRAVGHSVNAACTQCNSLLDVALDEVKVLRKAHENQRDKQQTMLIPLGTRGKLDGIEWEAIGFQERSSGSMAERYGWEETLLFNPRHGFRFLAQAQGHWTLYRVIKSGMPLPDNTRYARFFSGEVRTDYVLGEFYWRARAGDEVHVTDAISPPYVMSTEKNGEEITISLGVYLTPDQIAAAFALPRDKLPAPQGIAPNQPSPFARRAPAVVRTALIALAAATGIEFIQAFSAQNQLVHSEQLTVTSANRADSHVSAPFTLPQGQANLCLETHAVLDNNWAEMNTTLVNETSGERRNVINGMEYYYGVDGGERWSEGNSRAEGCFSAVPGGRYRLIMEMDAGVLHWGNDQQLLSSVQVHRDVPIWSNWFTLMLALLPYPFYLWLRHHSFEYTRWSDSDFMPESYASLRDSLRDSLNGESE